MKQKEALCKHNAARKVYKSFIAQCTFVSKLQLNLPPNWYLAEKPMNESTCRYCKCFERSEDDG